MIPELNRLKDSVVDWKIRRLSKKAILIVLRIRKRIKRTIAMFFLDIIYRRYSVESLKYSSMSNNYLDNLIFAFCERQYFINYPTIQLLRWK